MAYVDPLMVITALVFTVLLILANGYFIAQYSHHAESNSLSTNMMRVIIMIAFILAQSQVLLLALDVVNFREETSIDMFNFWQLIYLCSLIWTTFVLPFSFFYYDTDEDLPPLKRLWKALLNQCVYFIVFSCVHFPMFAALRHSYIPVDAQTYFTPINQSQFDNIFLQIDNSSEVQQFTQSRIKLHTEISFAAFTIGHGAFWGQIFLVFFLGTGLVSFPFSYILSYVDRPIPMNEG